MKLEQYLELIPKTIKPLGSQQADCNHMLIGMVSELNELADALSNRDDTNILEELGDFSWYLCNYALLRNIKLQETKVDGGYEYLYLVYTTSQLTDVIKKFLVYNKEINVEQETELVQTLYMIITNFYAHTPQFVPYKINYELAWDKNIEKLHKVRYKNATYSDEQAVNRDTQAERQTLEANG